MAVSSITYTDHTHVSTTINLAKLPRALRPSLSPRRTSNTTLSGKTEILLRPSIDIKIEADFTIFESLSLLHLLENWWQWAQQGKEWAFRFDGLEVDTIIAVDAPASASTIYVNDPDSVGVDAYYKIIDGAFCQIVQVGIKEGDKLTLYSPLIYPVSAGAVFRDQHYYPAVIRDPEAPSPITIATQDDKQNYPLTRFYLNLSFYEVTFREDPMLFKALSANEAGANSNSAQPWFPSSGGVSLAANTTYFFEGELRLSRASGTDSHTTSILFGGTATLTSIKYKALCNTGDTVANIAENGISGEVATAIVIKAASTSATEQISIRVTGIVRINATGTFIPQFQYSAAPGGAPTILANTFFKLTPEGSGSVVARGTWS